MKKSNKLELVKDLDFRGISFCHGREYLRFRTAEGKMIYLTMFPKKG